MSHCVAQIGLTFNNLPVWAFWVLGLQECATTSGWPLSFEVLLLWHFAAVLHFSLLFSLPSSLPPFLGPCFLSCFCLGFCFFFLFCWEAVRVGFFFQGLCGGLSVMPEVRVSRHTSCIPTLAEVGPWGSGPHAGPLSGPDPSGVI